MGRLLVILSLLAAFVPLRARAACGADPAGTLKWNGTLVQFCSNTTWVNLNNTNSGVGCSPNGAIQNRGPELYFCATTWKQAYAMTSYGGCGALVAGKFYYDSGNGYYWYCANTVLRRLGP